MTSLDDSSTIFLQMSAFDINTGLEEILPEMNFSRSLFSPILRGKYIYVFGGIVSSHRASKSCER